MSCKYGIARIFKSYGPCDDYSPESGQVVCSLMRKAISYPKEPFVVWGDGSKMRNLVYIDDLIDAFMELEKYIDKESLTVNLGGKRPIPIRGMAERIIAISKKLNVYDESLSVEDLKDLALNTIEEVARDNWNGLRADNSNKG